MNVIDEDPGLARQLSVEGLESARRDAVTRLVVVKVGDWIPAAQVPAEAGALGLLLLEGVIGRRVSMSRHQGLELFGSGDLVRPLEPTGGSRTTVPAEVGWSALTATQLALLDARFTRRMCAYPEVIDQLIGRIERRSSAHSLQLSIVQQPRLSTRVHLLLWHLAARFGQERQENGVMLPVPLSHKAIGHLVGAQRPSVSRALSDLKEADLVTRRPDGSWWLAGQSPSKPDTTGSSDSAGSG